MKAMLDDVEPPSMSVRTSPEIRMEDDELLQFCQINSDLRVEPVSSS
jgi:hypothetical protein